MGRRTPAVERCLDIFELLLREQRSLPASEVVANLALPRTTVHELLTTLEARGYLERDPSIPGAFRIGLELFRLGNQYSNQLDMVDVGKSVARRIAAACDETVHIAILDKAHVIYIAKVDSTRPVRMVSAEGKRLPAHCTAVGKAMLAYLDDTALAEIFGSSSKLTPMTERSITQMSDLLKELRSIRRIGVAVEECESNDDVCCIAAPVRDHTEKVVASMSVSIPLHRWSIAKREEISALVKGGAAEMSTRLGATDPKPRLTDQGISRHVNQL